MAAFLEEVLPVNVRMGAAYTDDYAVKITTTAGGAEYRSLTHNFPVRSFHINFTLLKDDLASKVLALYHRAYGMYAGFRVKCLDDFSTNGNTSVPTATDWNLLLVSTGVYQLIKGYGSGATPLGIGLPYRNLYKPVSGSTKVAISGLTAPLGWSVDTTTGRVTFDTNKTGTITGITKASQAVISIAGHSFVANETVYISGVSGMTQINSQRLLVVSVVAGVSITVDIDSTGFSTYTSGGTANTRPQAGEVVTGGCYFDIPCRFNSKIEVSAVSPDLRDCGGIDLIELLSP